MYVTNEISGDLSVIDVATERVVATIPLGKRPRGLRASPDGALLYVALSGSPIAGPGVDESMLPPPDRRADGIGIVDLQARRLLKVLEAGSDPEQVDVSADGKRLYALFEPESRHTYTAERLASLEWPDAGAPRVLTASFDRAVTSYGVPRSGDRIFVLAEDAGHENLYALSRGGNDVTPLGDTSSGAYSNLRVPATVLSFPGGAPVELAV